MALAPPLVVVPSFRGQQHFRSSPLISSPLARVRDLYPPWRWGEKEDAVEEAKLKHGLQQDLPDFYNMMLERPRQDARGYGLLHVNVRTVPLCALFFLVSASTSVNQAFCVCALHVEDKLRGIWQKRRTFLYISDDCYAE